MRIRAAFIAALSIAAADASATDATPVAEATPAEASPNYGSEYTVAELSRFCIPLGESYVDALGPTHVLVRMPRANALVQYEYRIMLSWKVRMFGRREWDSGYVYGDDYAIGEGDERGLLAGPMAYGRLAGRVAGAALTDAKVRETEKTAAANSAVLASRLATQGVPAEFAAALDEVKTSLGWLASAKVEVVDAFPDLRTVTDDSIVLVEIYPYIPLERDRIGVLALAQVFHRKLTPEHVKYMKGRERVPANWLSEPLAFVVGEGSKAAFDPPAKDDLARAALKAYEHEYMAPGNLAGPRLTNLIQDREAFEADIAADRWTPMQIGIVNLPRWAAIDDAALALQLRDATRLAAQHLADSFERAVPRDSEPLRETSRRQKR